VEVPHASALPALLEALGASRGWNTFRELFTGAMDGYEIRSL
jgi:hypothetical protein